MAGKSFQRRLAAILAADVVEYSRLMSIDEVRTLEALKAHRRELIDPAIAAHHGRIVKTTGDGALVEFASVVDAVGCAVVMQRGMVSRNAASLRTGVLCSASGSMSGISLSTAMTSSAMASILLPVWRPSASPAAYASRARQMIKSGTSYLSPLPTWGSRR